MKGEVYFFYDSNAGSRAENPVYGEDNDSERTDGGSAHLRDFRWQELKNYN
jgi:hypothetical protein